MNLFKVDDEERQLQMQLRKYGVETWFQVGTEEVDVNYDPEETGRVDQSINEARNAREENENYNMAGYVGENFDGDEVDEDFAPYSTFIPE